MHKFYARARAVRRNRCHELYEENPSEILLNLRGIKKNEL